MSLDLTSVGAILTPLVGAYAVYLRNQVSKNTKKIDVAEVNAENAVKLIKISTDSAARAIERADKANEMADKAQEIAYSTAVDHSKLRFDHANLQDEFAKLRQEFNECKRHLAAVEKVYVKNGKIKP